MENNGQGSSEERKLQCSDVSKCFQLLESILDGEMGEEGKEILKEKLDKCQPCFEHFHLEQAIREVLKTKCTKQPVPHQLADSIRQMIQESK
ncbi:MULTISPECIES: mycothiol system anti-sigma-R factor [Algoriphagus]|uniref:Mycothiol system anti-sigma-R factor n=2 Tax=Algoriphagus TaxID=246875 RepID=A0A4Y9QLL6_9BACT|nr:MULTISPECIES: mycothiol system anti-sigma-R factor [Algoriphagus]MCS5491355.1 mycothiol system anti-sigma-R factor [Algoriphagus limi]TFV93591.1 mycothiol system anti-sigma-R factor [Algoriphagus kandeliae]